MMTKRFVSIACTLVVIGAAAGVAVSQMPNTTDHTEQGNLTPGQWGVEFCLVECWGVPWPTNLSCCRSNCLEKYPHHPENFADCFSACMECTDPTSYRAIGYDEIVEASIAGVVDADTLIKREISDCYFAEFVHECETFYLDRYALQKYEQASEWLNAENCTPLPCPAPTVPSIRMEVEGDPFNPHFYDLPLGLEPVEWVLDDCGDPDLYPIFRGLDQGHLPALRDGEWDCIDFQTALQNGDILCDDPCD